MVVGFTTTYAIIAYHHWCCEFESRSGRGVQYHVIKFVGDLRQVGGFLRVLRHDIAEILLKVALSTIKQAKNINTINNCLTNMRYNWIDINLLLNIVYLITWFNNW
jgi:hypothetical protein